MYMMWFSLHTWLDDFSAVFRILNGHSDVLCTASNRLLADARESGFTHSPQWPRRSTSSCILDYVAPLWRIPSLQLPSYHCFLIRANAEQILSSASLRYFNFLLARTYRLLVIILQREKSDQGVALTLQHLLPHFARQPPSWEHSLEARAAAIGRKDTIHRFIHRSSSFTRSWAALCRSPHPSPLCLLVQRAASAGFSLQTHRWGNATGVSTPIWI